MNRRGFLAALGAGVVAAAAVTRLATTKIEPKAPEEEPLFKTRYAFREYSMDFVITEEQIFEEELSEESLERMAAEIQKRYNKIGIKPVRSLEGRFVYFSETDPSIWWGNNFARRI